MPLAGAAAVEDRAYFDAQRAKVMDTRDRTAAALRELGFLVLPSRTNFLFIMHPVK